MEDTSKSVIVEMLNKQKEYFSSGATKEIEFRLENLKRLKAAIHKHEKIITDALWTDLHKSYEEAYLTEISIVTGEIDYHIKNLKKWSRPAKVSTPLPLLPSSSKIIYEPLGVSLIISPWNYPFQLLINPLVGAISAGCCAILKPSPYTPNVAAALHAMINDTFDEKYIGVVQGGRKVNESLLEEKFDVIFFTGSPYLGKIVMQTASKNLTPLILELGGKSPCIIDEGANIKNSAMRIAWGKTINAGQTCIAPDYLFVHKSIKSEALKSINESIKKMHGNNIKDSKFYPRIVNEAAMNRLQGLMKFGRILYGGEFDMKEKFIEPTIIDNVDKDSPIMQEEIFGPLLPVIEFEKIETVIDYINKNEKPLALYYFGNSKKAMDLISRTTSGGGCINDTLLHIANHKMPFGGVGNSGLGKYHGRFSFISFSNQRSIVDTPAWIDLPLKYPPYKYFKWIKKIL